MKHNLQFVKYKLQGLKHKRQAISVAVQKRRIGCVVPAERQCKALDNFYLKYILGQNILENDCMIYAGLLNNTDVLGVSGALFINDSDYISQFNFHHASESRYPVKF